LCDIYKGQDSMVELHIKKKTYPEMLILYKEGTKYYIQCIYL